MVYILLSIRAVNFARDVLENLDSLRTWKLVVREVEPVFKQSREM